VPQQSSESKSPLFLLGALQGVVVLFGLYLVLRRERGEQIEDTSDSLA
jgi:hypothetical protein